MDSPLWKVLEEQSKSLADMREELSSLQEDLEGLFSGLAELLHRKARLGRQLQPLQPLQPQLDPQLQPQPPAELPPALNLGSPLRESSSLSLESHSGQPGHAYVCGGFSGLCWLESAERLDLTTGRWEPLPSMQTPRSSAACAVTAGNLHVCGGRDCSDVLNSTERLDLATLSWHEGPAMGTAREGACLGVLDSVLTICAGKDNAGNLLSSVECLTADAWVPGPPLTEPRAWAAAAVLDNKLYVCGGEAASGPSRSVETLAVSWNHGPPCLEPRVEAAAAAIPKALLLLGGRGQVSLLRSVEIFDQAAQCWHSLPPYAELSMAATASADGFVYVFGGGSGSQLEDSASCLLLESGSLQRRRLSSMSERRWGATAAVVLETNSVSAWAVSP